MSIENINSPTSLLLDARSAVFNLGKEPTPDCIKRALTKVGSLIRKIDDLPKEYLDSYYSLLLELRKRQSELESSIGTDIAAVLSEVGTGPEGKAA